MRTALLLLWIASLPGCRCSPSEDVLPASRSADPDARSACPPLPEWAGVQGDDIEADLLHVTETHGTGYRLLKNGMLKTWDDLELIKDDAGRMKLEKAPGAWRDRGPMDAANIQALRSAVEATDRNELMGARTGKGGSGNTLTHVLVWRGGQKQVFCYLGDNPPAGLEPIEKAMHGLMKRR
jgi:hypothetical protein